MHEAVWTAEAAAKYAELKDAADAAIAARRKSKRKKATKAEGLFPAFRNRLRADIISDCAARLREMDTTTAESIISTVPHEWDVPTDARRAWRDLICRRANYVADNVEAVINAEIPWFGTQGA